MKFLIGNDGGCWKGYSKQEFLEEIKAQVEDCERNGGTVFGIDVEADAYCFNIDEE